MGVLSGARNVVAFLTVLPVGMDQDGLRIAARHMYLFPLIGALIGFIAGGFGWLVSHLLPPLIVGTLTFAVVSILTGFHHTDGLLDFGDGIMAVGSPMEKINAMHDQKIGTGGVALGIIVFLTTEFSIAELGPRILQALIIAETSAKLSMVVAAAAGKSAASGMNTYFVETMHGVHGGYRLLASLTASLILAFVFLRYAGLVTIMVGIVTALAMVAVANRHFKGITGDVMGATNEIARMISVIAIMGMVRWAWLHL